MDIVVTGRRTDVSDRFRAYAIDKLSRMERLDHKVIRFDVEVSRERNPRMHDQCERVELTCYSRGPVIRAEAAAADPYVALDLACDKLQMRLRRAADRRRVHRGRKTPVSIASATAAAATSAAVPAGSSPGPATSASDGEVPVGEIAEVVPADDRFEDEVAVGVLPDEAIGGVDGDGPLVVREKVHLAEPMTLDQALLEMELVGHDFYLFHDKESGLPSVVYCRRAYDYGVIRLKTKE